MKMNQAAMLVAIVIASLTFDTIFDLQPRGLHRSACLFLWMSVWILAAQATVAIINHCKKTK